MMLVGDYSILLHGNGAQVIVKGVNDKTLVAFDCNRISNAYFGVLTYIAPIEVYKIKPMCNKENSTYSTVISTYNKRSPTCSALMTTYNKRNPIYNKRNPIYNKRSPTCSTLMTTYNKRNPTYTKRSLTYSALMPSYNALI